MGLVLNANQSSIGTLGLIDTTTNNPVTATFSSTSAQSDNTAVATVVVNPDGTVTVKAVSIGSANVTVSSTASYSDSNGAPQSAPLTFTAAVQVAQSQADSVALTVTFSTPTP